MKQIYYSSNLNIFLFLRLIIIIIIMQNNTKWDYILWRSKHTKWWNKIFVFVSVDKTCLLKHSIPNATQISPLKRSPNSFEHRKRHVRPSHYLVRRNHLPLLLLFIHHINFLKITLLLRPNRHVYGRRLMMALGTLWPKLLHRWDCPRRRRCGNWRIQTGFPPNEWVVIVAQGGGETGLVRLIRRLLAAESRGGTARRRRVGHGMGVASSIIGWWDIGRWPNDVAFVQFDRIRVWNWVGVGLFDKAHETDVVVIVVVMMMRMRMILVVVKGGHFALTEYVSLLHLHLNCYIVERENGFGKIKS